MRKNIVAGNWKMNTTLAEGLELAKGLNEALKNKTTNTKQRIAMLSSVLRSLIWQVLRLQSTPIRLVLRQRTVRIRKRVLSRVKYLRLWSHLPVLNMLS